MYELRNIGTLQLLSFINRLINYKTKVQNSMLIQISFFKSKL